MPAYNAEKYIAESIESVINQTYYNWELIIINDCSSDGTYEICKKYSTMDKRVKTITLNENGGIANARNRGLLECKGEYIAFLDSDDLWKPNKLEVQINYMNNNKIIFSYTSYEIISDEGTKTGKIYKANETLTFKELLKVNKIGCLTVMLDRTKISTIEMPNYRHEDYATWLRILRDNNCTANPINENLAYYRNTINSTSSNKLKTLKWNWRIYRNFLGFSLIRSVFLMCRFIINVIFKKMKLFH